MKSSHIIDSDDSDFTGDDWGQQQNEKFGLMANRSKILREELNGQVEEFLANGGKVQICATTKTREESIYNNKVVTPAKFVETIMDIGEHNKRVARRIYGGDTKAVEMIKEMAASGVSREDARMALGRGGRPASEYRFTRLIDTYFKGDESVACFAKPTKAARDKMFQDIKDKILVDVIKSNTKRRTIKEAIASAMENTGCTFSMADRVIRKNKNILKSLAKRKASCQVA